MSTQQSKRTSPETVHALWLEYQETGDQRLRDRLVLTFAPMVKYIVFRKLREIPAHYEASDLISSGLEALIRSIDRWDPDRGATLEQFAWQRIHGAVIDELRRHDWAPRSLRRAERVIERARQEFVALHARQPTNEELSAAIGLTVEQLAERMQGLARCDIGSLNTLVLGEDETSIERVDTITSDDPDYDPEAQTTREAARERFREVFAELPPRQQSVAVLLYVHELTLREVGEILGVTESRVCQIHGQLKKRLREKLAGERELFAQFA